MGTNTIPTDSSNIEEWFERSIVVIKDFTPLYLDKAVDIFFDVFYNQPWNYHWINKEIIKEYFTDLMKTPKFKAYLYLDKNTLRGVCLGTVSSCSPIPVYEIKEIFVEQIGQNKGIGSKMLKLIESDLNKHGIQAIKLLTMKTIPAYHFYMKNGFSQIEDSVNLFKILNQ